MKNFLPFTPAYGHFFVNRESEIDLSVTFFIF